MEKSSYLARKDYSSVLLCQFLELSNLMQLHRSQIFLWRGINIPHVRYCFIQNIAVQKLIASTSMTTDICGQRHLIRVCCADMRTNSFRVAPSLPGGVQMKPTTARETEPRSIRSSKRWRSPKASVSNVHLPMRSLEVKNRTSVDDIVKLRLITAIKTPYLPDGRFDVEAYDSLMHMQMENGVEGIIVGGTTGEGHLMTWDEHIMLIGHTVNCYGSSIKVIGNTGSNSTREAVHATEQGFAVGMHAALHINPYYGKTSMPGLLSHFQTVLPLGPGIIYNVPSRTGQDIPPDVINELIGKENFAGVKECVGNDRIKQYTDNDVVVWSGNDDQCHDARWDFGATGVISVTSNVVPGLMQKLLFQGKNETLKKKLLPLMKWLFCEPNPIAVNTALAQLGVVRPVFRLPYVPLPLSKRLEFVDIVRDLGRENFVGEKDVQVLEDENFILIDRY